MNIFIYFYLLFYRSSASKPEDNSAAAAPAAANADGRPPKKAKHKGLIPPTGAVQAVQATQATTAPVTAQDVDDELLMAAKADQMI